MVFLGLCGFLFFLCDFSCFGSFFGSFFGSCSFLSFFVSIDFNAATAAALVFKEGGEGGVIATGFFSSHDLSSLLTCSKDSSAIEYCSLLKVI